MLGGDELLHSESKRYDVVIVGAGVAGLLLALDLRRTFSHICVIESGEEKPADYYQALNHMESAGLWYDTVESRARAFGGSMHLWAGRCGVLDDIDYEKRQWVGYSGWPVSATDLHKYYARALRRLKYRHDPSAVLWPDDEPVVFPQMEAKYFALLDHVNGGFVGKHLRPLVDAAPQITVLERTTALSLESSDGEKIDYVDAVRDNKVFAELEHCKVFGKTFVLTAGGLESPRLLLNSRSLHPNGIGNDNDLVGRFFTDHPRMKSAKFRLNPGHRQLDRQARDLARRKQQLAYRLKDESQRRLELLNHSFTIGSAKRDIETVAAHAVDATSHPSKNRMASPVRRLWRKSPDWVKSLAKAVLSLRSSRDKVLVFKLELAPNSESRITLSNARDRHGMPLANVDWRITDQDRKSLARYFALVKQELEASGISDRPIEMPDPYDDRNYKDSSHPIGTLRMAKSPKTGVVDADLRVFGTPNLYVCSSAVFPTAGNVNPTLTVAALALRLADRLSKTTVQPAPSKHRVKARRARESEAAH